MKEVKISLVCFPKLLANKGFGEIVGEFRLYPAILSVMQAGHKVTVFKVFDDSWI